MKSTLHTSRKTSDFIHLQRIALNAGASAYFTEEENEKNEEKTAERISHRFSSNRLNEGYRAMMTLFMHSKAQLSKHAHL